MICERCQGEGRVLNPALSVSYTRTRVWIDNPRGLPLMIPCPECGGSGIAHCCEGLQAQPGEEG
jgi:hypothetical protein